MDKSNTPVAEAPSSSDSQDTDKNDNSVEVTVEANPNITINLPDVPKEPTSSTPETSSNTHSNESNENDFTRPALELESAPNQRPEEQYEKSNENVIPANIEPTTPQSTTVPPAQSSQDHSFERTFPVLDEDIDVNSGWRH